MLAYIFGYIALGIIVEVAEDIITAIHSKEWFGIECDSAFSIEDITHLSISGWASILIELLTWPIGIILYIRGINRVKKMSHYDIIEEMYRTHEWMYKEEE